MTTDLLRAAARAFAEASTAISSSPSLCVNDDLRVDAEGRHDAVSAVLHAGTRTTEEVTLTAEECRTLASILLGIADAHDNAVGAARERGLA